MEKAERLIQTWVASPRDDEVDSTVAGLVGGEIKLLHIVQGLGQYLTSEDDDLRNKGVEFLAKVVTKTPSEKLNRQAVKVLLSFFLSKLEDLDTIIPALKGLLALTRLPNLLDEDAVAIIRGVFSHVKMAALVQAQRFTVFSIVDNLIAHRREALQSLRDEFIASYVALADGEKDPRNLLVAFAIARVILIEFDTTNKIEDMFNITACYFPISFRPPPDDPYGISAEDLKAALRGCLSANAALAPMVIPLILEKVASAAPPTKRDVLLALDECLPVYGAGHARTHARKLWNALKLEIFQPTDPHTEKAALKSAQILIKTIYSGDTSNSEDMQGLAKDACEECVVVLKEPEKSQAAPAMKTLCAFISTTPSVCQYVVSQVIPHHIKLYHNPDEAPNRTPTLKLLSTFVVALCDSIVEAADAQIDLLAQHKDEVLGVFVTGLKSPSSSASAIQGLRALVTTPKLLDDSELNFIVTNVNDIISSDKEDVAEVHDDALDLLKTISIISPTHVSQNTLPLLFASLPDAAPARTDSGARNRYQSVLHSLSRLCEQSVLFETLVVRLSTKLDLLLSSAPHSAPVDSETTAAYAHAILNALAAVLEKKVERGDADVPKYIDRLVPVLLNLFIAGIVSSDNSLDVPIADTRLVQLVAKIVNLVTQTLPGEKQEVFAQKMISVYLQGDLKAIASSARSVLPEGSVFAPFSESAPVAQANLVCIFSQAIVALRKEAKIPVDDLSAFLKMLVQWSIQTATTTPQRDSARHIVATLVNKKAAECQPFLAEMLDSFAAAAMKDAAKDVQARQLAIQSWTWTCKGLLVQNHTLATQFIERLFELFNDGAVGWDAGRAVGDVVASSKILTKRNHAVVKLLHAQKYVSKVLPRLIEGAKDSSDPTKQTTSLVGLMALIRSSPKATYTHEMPVLFPLLLRGLQLPDTEIRADVIDALLSAAQAEVDADHKHTGGKEGSLIADHATDLTSSMLTNASIKTMPNARVRIAALRLLAILPKIVRYDVLHPHKATVVRELVAVLDDPKRSVRKEAVDARGSWFVYSG